MAVPEPSSPSHDAPAQAVSRCVLIVEDDDDSREVLGALITALGHRPVEAASAREGVAQALMCQPDLALIDIGLPDADGCEVARRLRQELPDASLRLVALTGYSDSPMRETAGAAGFDDYIVKPVSPEALERLLRSN